jgi:hypothetical protein
VSEYPEHDKITRLGGANDTVGEFLDWLQGQGIVLHRWQEAGNNGEPTYLYTDQRPADADMYLAGGEWYLSHLHPTPRWRRRNPDYHSWAEGWVPVEQTTEQLLAAFFGIDLTRLEEEKREMVRRIRNRREGEPL